MGERNWTIELLFAFILTLESVCFSSSRHAQFLLFWALIGSYGHFDATLFEFQSPWVSPLCLNSLVSLILSLALNPSQDLIYSKELTRASFLRKNAMLKSHQQSLEATKNDQMNLNFNSFCKSLTFSTKSWLIFKFINNKIT